MSNKKQPSARAASAASDLAKSQSAIQIPNLIEVQMKVVSALSADGFAASDA